MDTKYCSGPARMATRCWLGAKVFWLIVKKTPEVALSSTVSKWYLLILLAATIGIVDIFVNDICYSSSTSLLLYIAAWLSTAVGLVGSVPLVLTQLAKRSISPPVLLVAWLAIAFSKAWTGNDSCGHVVVKQLFGIAILCCTLIHLPEYIWLYLPYVKYIQLRPTDKFHATIVIVFYILWAVGLYPNWVKHARHFDALWITTAVLTAVSVYVKRSSWHAGESDAKPVPLLPISSVCHDFVHAIANTTVSMFWTMTAIAQVKGGEADDYLMCVVSVIVSLVHIGMSLQIWWQKNDKEDYACRFAISYRDPKEVLWQLWHILKHYTCYITTLNRYQLFMFVNWLSNFFLFMFAVSRINLGFNCDSNSPFPSRPACVAGNVASGLGMMLSQVYTLQPRLLGIGTNWCIPPKESSDNDSDNQNDNNQYLSISLAACSLLLLIGWVLILVLEKGWLLQHPGHLPAILIPLVPIGFVNCKHIWLYCKNTLDSEPLTLPR